MNANTLNILDLIDPDAVAPLELVRIGNSETAMILFSSDGVNVSLHYSDVTEIGGNVKCNGEDCILCKTGDKAYSRIMMPVYLPETGAVGVLPVSPTKTPFALLPQLAKAIQSEYGQVLFISRDDSKYQVTCNDLVPGADDGERAVSAFMKQYQAGEVDISAVYRSMSNERLAKVPKIATMMQLKGIRLPDAA